MNTVCNRWWNICSNCKSKLFLLGKRKIWERVSLNQSAFLRVRKHFSDRNFIIYNCVTNRENAHIQVSLPWGKQTNKKYFGNLAINSVHFTTVLKHDSWETSTEDDAY